MTKVVCVTSIDWPDLFPGDHPFLEALRADGFDASFALWDDRRVDWAAFDAIVIRSVWDYTLRREEFLSWIDAVSAVTTVFNPPRVLAWNSHKGYLRDIERSGVAVVPTEWLEAGTTVDLLALLESHGWQDAVVKPAVSAGARRTVRVDAGDPAAGQAHLDMLLPREDVMVQPYIAETESRGERSLVYFGGAFSHALRKQPALAGGDYSTLDVKRVEPDTRELELAERVLAGIPERLLYARADVILHENVAQLMELEVIEPQLYFAEAPASAEKMAAVLRSLLSAGL
ncbi:MAG: RimK family alpha-L-glutamate ligase [Actinomycetota bacterium]